jgi:hypothetical protein
MRRDIRANLCYLLKQLLGSLVNIRWEVVRPIQVQLRSRGGSHVPKLSPESTLADWHIFRLVIPFLMDFIKNCLLYAFFGVKVGHPSKAVLYLHRLDTSTADVLPKWEVQPVPEHPIFLLLIDCKDLAFSNLVLLFLSCFEALVEMSPAVPFSMLAKAVALLFAYLQMQLNIFNRELERSVDLTSAVRTFEIPPILYLSGMPSQERPVDLTLAIHNNASGENGVHPDLSHRHFFSACFIYASPSLSSLFSFLDMASLDLAEEAAATISSIRQ